MKPKDSLKKRIIKRANALLELLEEVIDILALYL